MCADKRSFAGTANDSVGHDGFDHFVGGRADTLNFHRGTNARQTGVRTGVFRYDCIGTRDSGAFAARHAVGRRRLVARQPKLCADIVRLGTLFY